MEDVEFSLDFHPESKAYFERLKKSGNASPESWKVEQLRKELEQIPKCGVEYDGTNGTKEEILVPSKEVEGQICVLF